MLFMRRFSLIMSLISEKFKVDRVVQEVYYFFPDKLMCAHLLWGQILIYCLFGNRKIYFVTFLIYFANKRFSCCQESGQGLPLPPKKVDQEFHISCFPSGLKWMHIPAHTLRLATCREFGRLIGNGFSFDSLLSEIALRKWKRMRLCKGYFQDLSGNDGPQRRNGMKSNPPEKCYT